MRWAAMSHCGWLTLIQHCLTHAVALSSGPNGSFRVSMTFRRRLASALRTTPVVATLVVGVPAGVAAATNPVVAENQQPGSSGWKLGSLVADDVTQQVKGYASATSVNQNASVTF